MVVFIENNFFNDFRLRIINIYRKYKDKNEIPKV